jgi:hypothetical protein
MVKGKKMKKIESLRRIREMIGSQEFKERHRTQAKYFSRKRVLTFEIVLMLIVQKSAKAIQLVLNEFLTKLAMRIVSKSAYSQARQHLSYRALIELNQKGVVEVMYSDNQYQRFGRYRLLGVDGSKVILPDSEVIYEEFGRVKRTSGKKGVKGSGYYSYAQASVLYDVLNNIALDSLFEPGRSYEVDLAERHLEHSQNDDLLLFDRNYLSYRWLATLCKRKRHFVIRCQRNSFTEVKAMFNQEEITSQIVTLKVPPSKRREIQERKLPEQLTLRLIRLVLDDGTVEVLITDLLDEQKYPTADFGYIYNLRWGVENFYGRLKTRLVLQNFSGNTVEAVKQDFFASVFVTALETLFTDEANAILQERSTHTKHNYQVNHAVSFNALKNQVFQLFYDPFSDLVSLCQHLTRLFLTDPTCIRPFRQVPRRSPNYYKRYVFHRHKRKVCF